MCTIWQMSTDQTVHLTDGGGGFKEVKILTLAQCHANNGPKETANKPYGIEFRLPRKGGNCDDGLLVCYPALLRRGNHLEKSRNFKVTRKFIVKAEMDNSLGKECVQNMPNNGHKNGTIIWRGIKLSTMPKQNDQNNGRIIILETSIVSKKHYPLGAGQLKISVLFASNQTAGNEPFTRLSSMENDFYGRSMQNDFFRSNGPSFLSDYADLWLLGLDMLPMAHQTEKQREQLKMELFISRSSKCFMEAWFVQPSHSLKPSDPKMQIAFSLCKPNPTEEQNERLFPKKVDKYVLPTGGGCSGLGNQMFRFAALYGIGKPYGRKPIYKNIDKCKKSHCDGCFQSYKFFGRRKFGKYFNLGINF
ncbi:hypothetical protein niasHT_038918 [Heterodera trifolii]|uniref:Uncharacterized protein n=1 Tax=Heterodera trifolii TaxID=157864 RepID=A0ABD2IMH2_9BILA